MKIYSFEKLNVWQNSRKLVNEIYLLTKGFSIEERYGITSQMRRAMISVSCNIAEGTSRWSIKEKVRYIEIAFGSLMEVLNCLILPHDLEYINAPELAGCRSKIDKIANQLNALANSYKRGAK